jgi:hypothetical protein
MFRTKVKSLRLISQALRHGDIWGSGGIAPQLLTWALDGGEWSASRPCRLTPPKRVPDSHWIEGWVVPRAGLDVVEKRKNLHCWDSKPGRRSRSPSLDRVSYPDSHVQYKYIRSIIYTLIQTCIHTYIHYIHTCIHIYIYIYT